jgi:phosphoribosyl 1,2-cyclic phosphate phosphodiesterase
MLRIEFLGTGGALSTPRAGCDCRICAEARARGVPYSRNGPAIFVHGPDLLIDTPEDIGHSLNRANIKRIGAVTWSHWHPDHTAGMRIFEALNVRLWDWPPQPVCTPVFIPQGVQADFEQWMGLAEQIDYLGSQHGLIKPAVVPDGGAFDLDGVTVEPLRLPAAAAKVYAFILSEGDKRVLIAPDELHGWEPPDDLGHFDLAILPMGLCEFDPLTGARRIPAEHPILGLEATFRQTLEMVRALDADKTIFVHIEEPDQQSYDDLMTVQRELQRQQPDLGKVSFAFDRLSVMP